MDKSTRSVASERTQTLSWRPSRPSQASGSQSTDVERAHYNGARISGVKTEAGDVRPALEAADSEVANPEAWALWRRCMVTRAALAEFHELSDAAQASGIQCKSATTG